LQVLELGKNLSISRWTFPSASALYLSIVANIPQPASEIALARQWQIDLKLVSIMQQRA
jgi:hypothetical protein